MANKDAAFGLRPIGKVGQNRDNQGLSEYSIAANDSTTIYFNDPVKATAAGTIDCANVSDVTLLGSLNGVFYTDPTTKKPTWANHYSQVNASDTVAFVADDPYERFEIQCDAAFALSGKFATYDIVLGAGDSANYVSKTELDVGTLSTGSEQLKVIGVTGDSENNNKSNATTLADAANVICTINEHFLKTTAGV